MKSTALRLFFLIPVIGLLFLFSNSSSARPFTNTKGQVIEATFKSATAETVTIIRTADGKEFSIPISSLSKEDRAYIAEQATEPESDMLPDGQAPHPEIKPGATVKVPFPDLSPDRRGEPASVGVKIPSSYDPSKPIPLFIWMGGGDGGNRPSTSGIIDGDRFITAGLPFPKGANNSGQANMVGDFDTIWEDYHLPMLTELFSRIPNIDKRLCILGGFSNGAHCIAGVLQEAKDGGYPEFFNCFILVDGGNGERRLKGGKGNYLFATWGDKSPNAGRTEDAAGKASGMEVEEFEMPDTGHAFAKIGQQEAKKWLDEVVIPATIESGN